MDFEVLVQNVYESILEDGDITIDAGAHVGRHTFPMARSVSPTGKVFCFEPLPMCRDAMLLSISKEFPELEKVISLYSFALSDYAGESEFVVAVDALGYSGLRERKYDCETKLKKIPVTVKKIDDVLADTRSLKYIKIDAEGGEFHIMRGGSNLIEKFRPLVTFEFGMNSLTEYHVIPEEVFFFWKEKRYDIFDIMGRPLTNERIFAESATIQEVWDYIALPNENIQLYKKVSKSLRKV